MKHMSLATVHAAEQQSKLESTQLASKLAEL